MKGLKNCPFCGGAVAAIEYYSSEKAFAIWHKDADTDCPFLEPFWISGDVAGSLAEAADAWNRRTEE